jgi:hypothetical protein
MMTHAYDPLEAGGSQVGGQAGLQHREKLIFIIDWFSWAWWLPPAILATPRDGFEASKEEK